MSESGSKIDLKFEIGSGWGLVEDMILFEICDWPFAFEAIRLIV